MNTNFRYWIDPIKEELKQHIEDNINYYDGCIDDLHHHLFNEDYYLIGYYNCEQWLKNTGLISLMVLHLSRNTKKKTLIVRA